MLDKAARVLTVRAGQKGIDFSCAVPPEVPDVLIDDQVRLRQILLNLLLNAVHASPEGELVSVVARPDADRLVLTVDNAGPAIPARRREHLFEPYFGEGEGEGHGLGLWVTYQLVQQMNGRIDVESVPDHTRFSVVLPLSDETHAS